MPSAEEVNQIITSTVRDEVNKAIVWQCTACKTMLKGNPRQCPECGYTVYKPIFNHDIERQPMPTQNSTRPVFEAVMEDIARRAEHGKKEYGTYLQINNGRKALQDLYEELLDACCYLKQYLIEEGPGEVANGVTEGATQHRGSSPAA